MRAVPIPPDRSHRTLHGQRPRIPRTLSPLCPAARGAQEGAAPEPESRGSRAALDLGPRLESAGDAPRRRAGPPPCGAWPRGHPGADRAPEPRPRLALSGRQDRDLRLRPRGAPDRLRLAAEDRPLAPPPPDADALVDLPRLPRRPTGGDRHPSAPPARHELDPGEAALRARGAGGACDAGRPDHLPRTLRDLRAELRDHAARRDPARAAAGL